MKRITAILCVVVLLALCVSPALASSVPTPTNEFYVNDFAGILTTATKQVIMRDSVALQQLTGAQIVVVTVDNLGGQVLETYSLNMLRNWGIGDKVKNNGVLILLSVKDRVSRIEVGYGLEGRLPDGKTGRIQDDYMLSYYKTGQYDEGIKNGYLAILQEVAAEYNIDLSLIENVAPEQPANSQSGNSGPSSIIGMGLLILLLLFDWIFLHGIITRTILLRMLWRGGRSGGSGGFGGGGGFSGGGGGGGGGGSSRGF